MQNDMISRSIIKIKFLTIINLSFMNLQLSLKTIIFLISILFVSTISSQNLLDTSTWTISSGSVPGFNKYGSVPENIREYGENHIGEEVVLWKAIPENITSGISDGGIYTWDKNIDHTNTYRLAIWMKKTNSNDGRSYFGCYSRLPNTVHHLLALTGNPTNPSNPYFWSGDLPKLDRWYLLVGYVHSSDYNSSVDLGKIYDGVTGEVVRNIYDFKFKNTATKLMLRSFLYSDPNPNDRQYLYDPRIDVVNNIMPTVEELLLINPDSRIFLTYDTAGNQTRRLYCPDSPFGTMCIPTATSKQSQEIVKEDIVDFEDDIVDDTKDYSKDIVVYPNPTKGFSSIKIKSELLPKIEFIKIYNTNSSLIQEVKFKDSKGELKVDLSGKPTGLYFVHIHFDDGSESVTKKIIKE